MMHCDGGPFAGARRNTTHVTCPPIAEITREREIIRTGLRKQR